ncbi:MAG: substrate-binding domain-containing protein [Thermoanaerobaculia bacterium]|nr:substrate-binding domain-containing protein [Thermoanaerobaculia bacterium]
MTTGASARVAILVALVTACGGGDGGVEERPRVAYVTNGVASFWVIAEAGAKAAGAAVAVDVDVLMPAEGIADPKRVCIYGGSYGGYAVLAGLAFTPDLYACGIDGIAVSPIDPANQTDLLDRIAQRTHLITQDSDAPASDRLLYIGMDNYDAGRLCGRLVEEAIPEGGTVYLFIGRLEQDNARRRRQGVIDELLDRDHDPERFDPPGAVLEGARYTILGTATDQFDRAKAKANVEDAVSRHGDIDAMVGLFAYNPPLILEALAQAGKLGDVAVIGFDEADETLQGIVDGTVYGTVVQNPWEYGYRSVVVLSGLVRDDPALVPEEEFVDIPARQIRRDDVAEFWADLKSKLGRE